jgi:hypothetical protein
MTEIEKLYKNAGVKKRVVSYCSWDSTCPYDENVCKTDECPYWKTEETKYYPPFTAEKQLKIMEVINEIHMFIEPVLTVFSCITNHKDKNGIVRGYKGIGKSMDDCLAHLLNNLWQHLTEAEQNEIREILK